MGRLNDVPTIAPAGGQRVAAPQLRLRITDRHVVASDRGRDQQHAGELNGVGIG